MPATNGKYMCPVEAKRNKEHACMKTPRARHRPCTKCANHHCWDCCVAGNLPKYNNNGPGYGCGPKGDNCPEPPITADCDYEIPEEGA